MKLYRCDWPNGSVSFVLATDKDDAICRLDEWGDADAGMLTPQQSFMIDFEWELDDVRRLVSAIKSLPDGGDDGELVARAKETITRVVTGDHTSELPIDDPFALLETMESFGTRPPSPLPNDEDMARMADAVGKLPPLGKS